MPEIYAAVLLRRDFEVCPTQPCSTQRPPALQIRAAAQKGLKITDSDDSTAGKRAAPSGAGTGTGAGGKHPSFSQMLATVRAQYKVLRTSPARSTLAVPTETLTAILRFLDACHDRDGTAAAAPAEPSSVSAAPEGDVDMAAGADVEGDDEEDAKRRRTDDEAGAMDVDGDAGAEGHEAASDRASAQRGTAGAWKVSYGGPEHLVLLEHALVRCDFTRDSRRTARMTCHQMPLVLMLYLAALNGTLSWVGG